MFAETFVSLTTAEESCGVAPLSLTFTPGDLNVARPSPTEALVSL